MSQDPHNYSSALHAAARMSQETAAYYAQMLDGINRITQAESNLQAMPSVWNAAVTFIDTQAAANPADKDWEALLSQKDKIAADFAVDKTKVTEVKNAAIAARDA